MNERICIRGVGVDNVTLAEAASLCETWLNEPKTSAKCVFTPNSEIIQMCVEQPEYYPLINSADLVTPDGIGVVYASKILRRPLKAKTAGYELGLEVCRLSNEQGHKLFFLGSKPGVAEAARDKLRETYPNLNVAGVHDGYFKKEGPENDAVIEAINEAAPDVLYVCLGVPAQEKWIAANKDKLPSVRLCLALGGSLDGYSGSVKRAPKIFIRLGLEWFYRLLREPKRIGRMMKLPKFLFGVIFYRLSGKSKNDAIITG